LYEPFVLKKQNSNLKNRTGEKMNKIHPSSLVHANAILGEDIEIGPFCTVGPEVHLGDGCRLISHVVLDGPETKIGQNNTFYPFCIVGIDPQDKKYNQERTRLIVGDDNVFRESVSVHRGSAGGGETRIGDGNLLMGHVHVAHDCVLGNHNVLVHYVGLSGHVVIDDHVTLGGRVGVVQFHRIGSYAYIGGASVVDKNVPPFASGYGDRLDIKSVNIVGLKREGFSRDVIRAVTDAHRLYFRSGLGKVEALRQIKETLGEFEEVRLFTDFLEADDGQLN